jgi:transposase
MKGEKRRFVGIDLSKRTYVMAIVSEKGRVSMSNGRTTKEGRAALCKLLCPSDKIAPEAGNLAFRMAKEIKEAVGCEVRVLNPTQLALIYGSMWKTDKEDALKPAHIPEDIKDDRLPMVDIPSEEEQEKRKPVSARNRVRKAYVQAINVLHALFVSAGITTVKKKHLRTAAAREEAVKLLSGLEREEAEYLLRCLKLHTERINELETKMKEATKENEELKRLQSIPGVGVQVSYAFLAHVAVERFENASALSNYLGLVPRVYMSGEREHYGHITKRGCSCVRTLLVQAAWSLIRSKSGGCLKERYEHMTKTKGVSRKKAVVAIARRLGELMYTLIKKGTVYEQRKFKAERADGHEVKPARLALQT